MTFPTAHASSEHMATATRPDAEMIDAGPARPGKPMRWNNSLALLLGLSVAACGSHGATTPTAPVSPSPTLPSSALMRGSVSDTAFRYVAGATIEIVNGPSAGLTTMSDGRGEWAFPPGAFDDSTQFRATKDGYEPAIMPLGSFCAACNPNRWVNFVLKLQVAPASIAGSYTMTITGDRCTNLPEQVRTRTYAVTLPSTAANAYFSISPTGANFVPGWNQVDGGLSGNYAALWFETLVEEVAPGNYLLIGMSAGGLVDPEHPATITMRADGRISYCTVDAASGAFDACLRGRTAGPVASCDSPQHTIVLTRR